MATEWKVIRVASEVLDALQEVRQSLWRAHKHGQVDGVLSRVDTITDNAVVAYLARHYQKHRERRTRSRKRCRQARKEVKNGRVESVGAAGSASAVASVETVQQQDVLCPVPDLALSGNTQV